MVHWRLPSSSEEKSESTPPSESLELKKLRERDGIFEVGRTKDEINK